MFGLAACDEGGPGFVNASVRTVTNARQVGMRMQSKFTHRHARVGANNTREEMEHTGTWVPQVARAMEEARQGIEDAGTEEESKGCKEDTRYFFTKMTRAKEPVTWKMNWRNSCTTVSRNCSACREGWHWEYNKGGWLDLGLCAKASREEVEYIRRHKMCTRVPERRAHVRRRRRPSRQDGRRLTRDNQGSPTSARHTQVQSCTRRRRRWRR